MPKQQKLMAVGTAAANAILAGAGLLCVAAFSYFLYLYGWSGQRQFTSWAGVLLYYIAPALLAILLFASLRLRKPLRINLAMCVFSAAVSIFMLETLLTLWSSLPTVTQDMARKRRAAAAEASGIEFDPRTKTQVVDDLRAKGVDAVLSVFPQALLKAQSDGTMKSLISVNGVEVLPLAGVANKVVVVCNEGGQYLTYGSDQYGFNNARDIWGKGSAEIVTLGDSFVQGWCVHPDENFVAVIRKRHPATVNLGMEGGGPLTMLATLKEYAPIVRPRVVLWFYYEGNDLGDLQRERQSPLLRRYLTDGFSQNLPARQPEIDRALDEHVKAAREENRMLAMLKEVAGRLDDLPGKTRSIIKLSELRDRLGLVPQITAEPPRRETPAQPARRASADPGPLPKRHAVEIELLANILRQAKEFAGGWGGALYFVYLPAYLRYAPEQGDFYRDHVLQAANSAGLPVIDIHPAFAARKDPLGLFALRLHSHYTQEGHKLVAEQVLRPVTIGK